MDDLTTTYPDNFTSKDNVTESSSSTYTTKEHWTEVLHENQIVRQCKHCNKKRYSVNTSKSYLKKHTISCTTQDTKFSSIKPVTKEDVDNSIIDLVISSGISFNVLNSSLFRRMVNKLHYVTNTYKVPHPTTISRHLSGSIYEIRHEFINGVMAEMPGRISLTCDGWHSTVHRCHYTVVTGSWISDNWKIVNIILSFQKSGQTAKDIKSVIINTLNDYNIRDKIFSLTMDNTTTNKAVTRMLQDELPNINLISIGCMCHILNLIVKAGLGEIDKLRQKVHKVMKYLANPLANGRLELLESYCRVVGVNFLRPVLEIDIRWNSTLAMFERYIILHPMIKEMYLKEPSMPSCLETEELLELESFCQILKPFEFAITILSKDQSNSISDALTIILEIEQHINNIRHNSNAVCLMKKKFQKYWTKISDHVLIAHVLDPKYKMEHLRATVIEIGEYSESEAEQYVNSIRQKILLYGTKYISSHSSISEIDDDNTAHDVFFPKRRILKKRRTNTGSLDYELELYEREPLENFKNESDDAETNLNEKTISRTILMHSWLKESQKKSSPLKDLPETK
ncbi:2204_t:CDS:2 [Gigaspora margarita]|uniref:2204_t:CDS:1 n=1 Tax=Gigaspora margarita TaxID=4874 RepID=A0ABM8W2U9_GIGMA|nr:2204_t:CDS:2 [Gigaspora margarita]